MKKYCSECEYYDSNREVFIQVSFGNISSLQECCNFSDNLIDSYYKKNNVYKKLPRNINRHNNCKWFKEVIIC